MVADAISWRRARCHVVPMGRFASPVPVILQPSAALRWPRRAGGRADLQHPKPRSGLGGLCFPVTPLFCRKLQHRGWGPWAFLWGGLVPDPDKGGAPRVEF